MLIKTKSDRYQYYKINYYTPHNPHGPAWNPFKDGITAYYLNGIQHNIVGPARIYRNTNVEEVMYYINGYNIV